jgi:peptidyl-prolyl cis-trans isomerase C
MTQPRRSGQSIKQLSSVAVLASSFLFSGCASTSYLAKVNDEKITGPELKQEFIRRHGGHQKFLLGVSETRQFLDVVIDQDLLIQEGYRLDLENIPEVRNLVSEYAGRKATDYFVKVEIQEKAHPTPEQIKQVWERETSELYQTRQIVLDTRAEAEAVYLQLLFGGDFERLARECSIAASRVHGGRLAPVRWGAKDPAWEKAVFSLSPGEMSAVFETPEGWQIVELVSVDVVDRPDFDKASPRIQTILEKRMVEQRRREMTDFLWTKYHARETGIDLGPEALHEAVTKTPDAAIAVWDGGKLTVKDFVSAVDWTSVAGDLPGRFRREIETQLRQTVNADLALLEARARGYEKAPEVAQAVRRYQEDLMERALYADYIFKGVTVTDEEIRAYYDQHKNDFMAPEKRRVSHIVVPTREEAEEIEKEIAGGERFEKLVLRSTDTGSAKKAGDLGWVSRPEAVGELEAVFSLEEGKVSGPIASRYGYHLFLVTEIVSEQPLDFEEAKERVRKRLIEEKERERRKLWIQRLREASRIDINNAGIRAFVKANTAS